MLQPFLCFNSDVVPRQPFSKELTHLPPRSRYAEVFIATWTFSGSGLLIVCARYATANCAATAAAAGGDSTIVSKVKQLMELCIMVIPYAMCMLDYPAKDYWPVVCSFNLFSCLCSVAAVLHRFTWGRQQLQQQQQLQQLPQVDGSSSSDGKGFNDIASRFRSIVYICTALCVFARDLPCWNNFFSKTYSFGNGVMDIGLGCFIVCIGMLGPTAGKSLDQVDGKISMHKALQISLLLAICGAIRFVAIGVKNHVQGVRFETEMLEYGVHWNAFFSLSVAKLIGTWVELRILPKRAPPLLAAALLWLLQELLLSHWLAAFVLAPGKREPYNRSNLIGQNREGLTSVLGIVPLYLAGLQIGRWCQDWCKQKSARNLLALSMRLLLLLLLSLSYRILECQLPWLLLPESRRLFNMSYCIWILAFTAFCLINCCLIASLHLLLQLRGQVLSTHIQQIDQASLIYFITSQLLTSIGNALVTLAYPWRESMPAAVCFGSVLVYMMVTSVIAVGFHRRFRIAKVLQWLLPSKNIVA